MSKELKVYVLEHRIHTRSGRSIKTVQGVYASEIKAENVKGNRHGYHIKEFEVNRDYF